MAFTHIQLGDGVPVGVGHVDAMGLHPGPNDVLLHLADVPESMQIIPQVNDEAGTDALMKGIHSGLGHIVELPNVLVLEMRQKYRQRLFTWLSTPCEVRYTNQKDFKDVVLYGVFRERHSRSPELIDNPLLQIWFHREFYGVFG